MPKHQNNLVYKKTKLGHDHANKCDIQNENREIVPQMHARFTEVHSKWSLTIGDEIKKCAML